MKGSINGLKVGDKVTGFNFEGAGVHMNYTQEMVKYEGQVGTILDLYPKGFDGNFYAEVLFADGAIYWYPAETLSTIPKSKEIKRDDGWSGAHYNFVYTLTDKDKESGTIMLDPYFVAKQWRTGGRDDSGILIHQLKTIARFGEKNGVAREIKAMYEQSKALGRIYGIDLEGK